MARTKQIAKRSHVSKRKIVVGPNSTNTPPRSSPRKNPASSAGGEIKRSHRYKPGTQALREIRRLQKTVNLLIPAAPFIRTAAEDYIIQLFEDSMLCAIQVHVTVMKRDWELARRLGKKGQSW